MSVPQKNKPKSDSRFNLDDTPITSPWRSYNRFNKYDESYPITAFEAFTSGKTMAQVARALECSVPTLKRWMLEIEEFGEAVELGITNFQADFEDMYQANMVAPDDETPLPEINTKLVELYAKSQFPATYNERHIDNTGVDPNKNENDGASALLDLLTKTDKLSIQATTPALEDGTPAQNISIEKNTVPQNVETKLVDITSKSLVDQNDPSPDFGTQKSEDRE